MRDGGAIRLSLYLILVTHLAFFPVAGYPFLVYDDSRYVYENPMVRDGLSAAGFRWAWTTFRAANWHPLTWLSHMLDWQLFGNRPGMHHYTSLLLHLANAVGLFLVLRRMTGLNWRSALVAALFALHPLRVESVTWVAERKDVLSTFFGILTLWAYAGYTERPGIRRYLAVAAALTLSLLAKPMLVTLPFVLLLLDYWPLKRFATPGDADAPERHDGRGRGRLWLLLEKAPLLMLSVASCIVTCVAQRAGGAVVSADQVPLKLRLENAVVAYVSYLRKMVWPNDLAILYPHPLDQLPLWQVLASGLCLLLLTALAVGLRRRCPYLLVGWLWYLGTLVPVIGLVQVGVQAMADRYTYVPLIGIFLALAWSIPSGLIGWGRVGVTAAVSGVLVGCMAGTLLYLRHWRDDRAVWQRALQVTVNNPVAHLNWGTRLYREGKLDEAEAQFVEVLRLRPTSVRSMNNLGICYWRRGRLEDAVAVLSRAVALDPNDGVALNNLGIALYQKGRLEEACRSFREAVRLDPDMAEYHCNLATALEGQGSHQESEQEYQWGLRLDPGWPLMADRMAGELLRLGKSPIYCPAEAVFRARQACQATRHECADLLDTLAAAYAAMGRLEEAVAAEKRASDVAGSGGRPELVQQFRGRLQAYEANLAEKRPAR